MLLLGSHNFYIYVPFMLDYSLYVRTIIMQVNHIDWTSYCLECSFFGAKRYVAISVLPSLNENRGNDMRQQGSGTILQWFL